MPQSTKNLSRPSPWALALAGAALFCIPPLAQGQNGDALTPPDSESTEIQEPETPTDGEDSLEDDSYVPEVEGSSLLTNPGAASSGNNIGGMPASDGDFGIQGDPSTNLNFGGSRPNVYVVVRGDTMWDISGRFWGDPYFWPTLWSYNPSIGNAHFIYPGNVLRFSLGSPVRPPGMSLDFDEPQAAAEPQAEVVYDTATDEYVEVAVSNAMECRPPIPFVEAGAGEEIRSSIYGFLDDEDRVPLGRIVRSPAEKEFLSNGDILFVEFSRLSEVECGDIYSVYREVEDKVRPPGRLFGSVGSLSALTGEIRVVDIGDDYATAQVEQTYAEIRRGDLLQALVPVRRRVKIRSATKEVDGQIVAAMRSNNTSLSMRDVVFIDRGEADGLAPGDTFYITREGDGLKQYRRRGDNLPPSVIGKLVVIDLGESMSTAMIIESARALKVGDRISMQVF